MHHVTFLPNAMHVGGGDLLNVVVSMSGRAKWVAETLYGDDWMANRTRAAARSPRPRSPSTS